MGEPELGHEVKGHAERLVPGSPQLAGVLEAHRARLEHSGPEAWVFQRHVGGGSQWTDEGLAKAVREVFRAAGLGGGLHRLRHTAATRMLGAGVDVRTVQAVLGHSSAAVLLEHYAGLVAPQLARAGEVLGKLAS